MECVCVVLGRFVCVCVVLRAVCLSYQTTVAAAGLAAPSPLCWPRHHPHTNVCAATDAYRTSPPTTRIINQVLVDAQRHPDAYGFEEAEGAAEIEEEKALAKVRRESGALGGLFRLLVGGDFGRVWGRRGFFARLIGRGPHSHTHPSTYHHQQTPCGWQVTKLHLRPQHVYATMANHLYDHPFQVMWGCLLRGCL